MWKSRLFSVNRLRLIENVSVFGRVTSALYFEGRIWRLIGGICILFAVVLIVTTWRAAIESQANVLDITRKALRRSLPAVSHSIRPEIRKPDFAQRLPLSSAIDSLVYELQRASAAEGVAFVFISSTPRAATTEVLGRTEISITLRGTYPKLKSVIADSLDRFPALLLRNLTIQRMITSNELEARVDFLLVSRALADADEKR